MNTLTENAVVETAAAVEENMTAAIAVNGNYESNFFAAEERQSLTIKPSDKDRKAAEVEKVVAEGEELCKQHESYYDEYVVRGNKALYEVLAKIYAYVSRPRFFWTRIWG